MADKMQVDIPAFSDALEKIWRASNNERRESLHKCVLPLAGLVDEQGHHLGAVDQSFDASFLDPLRSENDFLPQQLFVRQEVKDMVSKLASVHKIGLDKRLIYLRKTEQEDQLISLFVMEKSPNGDCIHVVFGREISIRRNPNLTELVNTIIDASGLRDDAFYIMLDGPRHNDPREDLLYGSYDCLCTSGGYPAIKQEQIGVKEILVLNGWTEAKFKEAMRGMNIHEPHKKYDLCGGRIRLALLSDTAVKQWFDTVVTSPGPGAIKLVVTNIAATGCTDSSDRLRTRFFHIEGETAQGWFYDEILHRRFRELKQVPESPRKGWKHEEGTGADGVASFVAECVQGKTSIYWAPGIPDFANIDAAILRESLTLICFQYTVQASHAFDKQSFWGDFVNHLVVNQVQIEAV